MSNSKEKTIDITKTGGLNYRELQALNNPNKELNPDVEAFLQHSAAPKYSSYDPYSHMSEDIESPLAKTNTPWGESIFDEDTATEEDFSRLGDIRAENQPWISKWASGLGKGISLAGTTFLDGTLGLMYGVGDMIFGREEGESGWKTFSRLWDNEISNGLHAWNKAMEDWLPNYRTQEEADNAWYENLGTANFWADSFLKNLGFTVGAFYSGGAWNKALKGIGVLKNSLGAQITGSILSGINEARVEANNNSQDKYELDLKKLQEAYAPLVKSIEDGKDSLVRVDDEDGISWISTKQQKLAALSERYNKELAKLEENKAKMGAIDFVANSVFLPMNNLYMYGRLYARGYQNAKTIAGDRITKEAKKKGMEQAMMEEGTSGRITKEGTKYLYEDITTKEALGKGLKSGIVEGNEEMTQQMFASTSGYITDYDSPDAYYNALVDPTAENQTNDLLTSITKGFTDSYGSGDQYEQFAVGFLTGILGIPTFGKVSNSDANTYLGRGKSIGLSGGIFGELSSAKAQNEEGREAVDYVNKYMQKLQENKLHFVQSQAFSNAMSGFSEDSNAFEYKNFEDNDDFAAISRFAKIGRLNDLKELVNQDFENLSDEELDVIAKTTSNEDPSFITGWKNVDGSYKSESEDGRAFMRQELIKKRDKILREIDGYEKHLAEVRGITNNALTDDQTNELAWLGWKLDRFDERFKSIKENNTDLINLMSNNLLNFKDAVDEESEEGKKWIKNLDNLQTFISYLQGAKTSLDLALRIQANPKAFEAIRNKDVFDLFVDQSGISYLGYKKLMDDLSDAAKIASSYQTFNDRYREFLDNPIKLIENREKIDKKKEAINKTTKEINTKSKLANSEVSDIVAAMDEDDDLASALEGFDFDAGSVEEQAAEAKLEKAKAIKEKHTKITNTIDEGVKNGTINPQIAEDAKRMLDASKKVSQDEEELTDTLSEVFNDPNTIFNEEDMSVADIQYNQEELKEIMDKRQQEAKSLIEEMKSVVEEAKDDVADLPKDKLETKRTIGEDLVKETGHDSVTPVVAENEKNNTKEEKEKKDKEELEKKLKLAESKALVELSLPYEVVNNQMVLSNEVMKDENMFKSILANIRKLIESGATNQEVANFISETDEFKSLIKYPNFREALNNYTKRIREILNTPVKQEEKPKEKATEESSTYVPDTTTLLIDAAKEFDRDYNEEELPKSYNFWKPTTSKLPIHVVKGDYKTPFYEIAKFMTVGNGKDKRPRYLPSQLKRMEAIYKYINDRNGFDYIDNGDVQAGDKIFFMVDPQLNKDAGEFVILMVDKNNRVVGDVMSENDRTFSSQIGLPEFVQRIKKEFEFRTNKDEIFISEESSEVDKLMIGKVPYQKDSEPLHTLNEIFTTISSEGTPVQNKFLLGISVTEGINARILATPGRTKKQGLSNLERSILPPLDAKIGQPFLLLKTNDKKGRRQLITVPFTMKTFSYDLLNTRIGQAIKNIISNELPNLKEGKELDFVDKLKELLVLPDTKTGDKVTRGLFIKVEGDNISVINNINGKSYKGSKSNPDLANIVTSLLYGMSFQVSRKYINDTYDGMDYNSMIGEIAETNLEIGTTHTISNWFTVKPLSSKGEVLPARSPKSTGVNPFRAAPKSTIVTIKDKSYSVNNKTFEITDNSTGKVLSEPEYKPERLNIIRAYAYGFMTNQTMNSSYRTEWGYFNPKTFSFEEEPKRVVRELGLEGNKNTEKSTQKPFGENVANNEDIKNPALELPKLPDEGLFNEEDKAGLKEFSDKLQSFSSDPIVLNASDGNSLKIEAIKKDTSSYGESFRISQVPLGVFRVYPAKFNPMHEGLLKIKILNDNTIEGEITLAITRRKVTWTATKVTVSGPLVEEYIKRYNAHIKDIEEYKKTGFKDINEATRGSYAMMATAMAGVNRFLLEALNASVGKPIRAETLIEKIPNTDKYKIQNNNQEQGVNASISRDFSLSEVRKDSIPSGVEGVDFINYNLYDDKDLTSYVTIKDGKLYEWRIVDMKSMLYGWKDETDIYDYEIPKIESLLNKNVSDSSIFNLSEIDTNLVDIEIYDREKTPGFKGRALKIYIKGEHNKGYFELVKDKEDNYYSVHFKTGDPDTQVLLGSTREERALLFEQLRNAIPNGAYVSTWGNVSEKGQHSLDKVGKGYNKVGEREVKDRKGNKLIIPIYQKPNVQSSNYISEILGEESLGSEELNQDLIESFKKGELSDASSIQRKYAIGFIKAGRIFDALNGYFNSKGSSTLQDQQGTTPETSSVSEGDVDKQAEEKGLLGNNVRKDLWEQLTLEQKTKIVNKKGPKQKQWMTGLEAAFNTNSKEFSKDALNGSVDDFLNRKGKFRREDGHSKEWNSKKELRWMHKVLPNLSNDELLRIQEGLIKISDEEGGGFAYGQFKDGIITISTNAAKGTLYHEAFHAVVNTLLTEEESKKMFEAAKAHYGNISNLNLEENLAEDFRRYVQIEQIPLVGNVVKFFRTIKHIVQSLVGKEPYINNLFYRINRGKLSRNKEELDDNRFIPSAQEQVKTIEQYHRDKLLYGNLKEKQKQYIKDRGISIEEYNAMSVMEKEVLIRCM